MRLICMTDVHANLPALQAALAEIRKNGYDMLVHTGDATGIGPYPAECVELLMNTPNVRLLMGNHESWFVNGLPDPLPPATRSDEVEHLLWTHKQLGPMARKTMADWPYRLEITEGDTKCAFMHYALNPSGQGFAPIVGRPTAADLDGQHASSDASIVFFGHDHSPSDVQGTRRYVNPGALGCSKYGLARYCSVEISQRGFSVEHHAVVYDTAELFRAFQQREVPDRDTIQRVRFGRET